MENIFLRTSLSGRVSDRYIDTIHSEESHGAEVLHTIVIRAIFSLGATIKANR